MYMVISDFEVTRSLHWRLPLNRRVRYKVGLLGLPNTRYYRHASSNCCQTINRLSTPPPACIHQNSSHTYVWLEFWWTQGAGR